VNGVSFGSYPERGDLFISHSELLLVYRLFRPSNFRGSFTISGSCVFLVDSVRIGDSLVCSGYTSLRSSPLVLVSSSSSVYSHGHESPFLSIHVLAHSQISAMLLIPGRHNLTSPFSPDCQNGLTSFLLDSSHVSTLKLLARLPLDEQLNLTACLFARSLIHPFIHSFIYSVPKLSSVFLPFPTPTKKQPLLPLHRHLLSYPHSSAVSKPNSTVRVLFFFLFFFLSLLNNRLQAPPGHRRKIGIAN
jgi:hypothetical protein